jgi:hypothetical protein
VRDSGASGGRCGRARSCRLESRSHTALRDFFQRPSRNLALARPEPRAPARLHPPPGGNQPTRAPRNSGHFFCLRAGVQPVPFEAGSGRLLHRRRGPRLYRDAGRTARRSARRGSRVRPRPGPQRRLDTARVDRRRHRRRRLHRATTRPRDPHRRRSAGPLTSPQEWQVDDAPRPFRVQPDGSVRRRAKRRHLLCAELGARRSAHAVSLLSAGVSHAARRSRLGRTGRARSGRRVSRAARSRRA